MPYAAHFLNAFLLCVVLVIGLHRIAAPIGLVDRPTGRKLHAGAVPLTGGVAMFVAFVFASVLVGRPLHEQAGLLVGLSMLVAVGVVDDLRDLRPLSKLVAQCGAAVVMVLLDWRVLESIGGLVGPEPLRLGVLALPFSLLFIVGLINAINMIDGLDGLAGGVVASILFWLALIAVVVGKQGELVTILLLLFATLGFLVFNLPTRWRPAASVFMGDAGSMMLGASVAYFAIALASGSGAGGAVTPGVSLPALCWLLVLPVVDTLSLIVRRLLAGTSPFAADRRHLHHLLLEAGLAPSQATLLLVGTAVLLGGIGFAGVVLGLPDSVMAAGLLVPFAAHTAFVYRRPGRHAKPSTVGATSDAALS